MIGFVQSEYTWVQPPRADALLFVWKRWVYGVCWDIRLKPRPNADSVLWWVAEILLSFRSIASLEADPYHSTDRGVFPTSDTILGILGPCRESDIGVPHTVLWNLAEDRTGLNQTHIIKQNKREKINRRRSTRPRITHYHLSVLASATKTDHADNEYQALFQDQHLRIRGTRKKHP